MAEVTNTRDYREKWRSISKTSRVRGSAEAQGPLQRQITVPPAPSEEPARVIIPQQIFKMQYLLYDRKPLCLLNGILYAMYPIEDPSLGYKLVPGNYDQKMVLLNPHFINEMQAVRLLFAS